jgi:predicted CxxxxCH...CXXCH cytochrome family protein
LHDPGHIDHPPPAIVFPNIPGVGTLARADGAQPSYDSTAVSCGSVYCHGNGAQVLTDPAPGLIRTPVWTGGVSQVACGAACHRIPPQDGFTGHLGATLTDCHNCHPQTITATGAIIVTRDPVTGDLQSTHINGQVDF